MPYIIQTTRDELDYGIDHIPNVLSDGELNYVITSIIQNVLSKRGKSYTTLNATIGVLECVKQELYRRVLTPYEEEKMAQNGDVYRATQ